MAPHDVPRPHERLVGDLNAAELLEEAIASMAGLGVSVGTWSVTLHVEGGRLRRLVARRTDQTPGASLDRRGLSELFPSRAA